MSPPTDTAHPAPLLRGASSSSLAAQQREQRKKRIRDRKAAAIERLAAPKFLSAKLPFQMAWIEAGAEVDSEALPERSKCQRKILEVDNWEHYGKIGGH